MTRAGQRYHVDPDTYDAVTASIVADIPVHLELVRAARGSALEVCCGNGRLLLPTLEAGLACEGLDYDAPMLESLRGRLAARGLATPLHHADMRDFTLPRRYALIVIPFNSFLHNLTQEDQLATLRCCRTHLEDGGRLAIVAFHPSVAKLQKYAEAEHLMFEHEHAGRKVRVYDQARDDRIEQVRRVARRVEFLDDRGRTVEERQYDFDLRYAFKPEMELLFRVAGFARWEMRPAFADYREVASGTPRPEAHEGDVLLWTAWRS